MEIYNSKKECPKCGCFIIRTIYRPKVDWVRSGDRTYNNKDITEEHLTRICEGCGFRWPEACLG